MKTLLFLLLLAFSLYAKTTYEDAYALYKKGEYKKSLELFKELANEEEDYDAAYILGFMYEHGEGCDVDLEESKKWYKFSSHGYYWQRKVDPARDIEKEHQRLYKTIDKSLDKETLHTIRQYAEGLYNVKAHATNYFLPVSYRTRGAYDSVNGHDTKNTETEFQVSLKYDFASNIFGLHEIYTAAYTQKSYWQLYMESAYFRETNYNPEFFITVPIGSIGKFDYIKAFRWSFEHQSNGRGGDEERSWNYTVGTFYLQTGIVFTELKLWKNILNESLEKYNDDLMDYMGYGQIKVIVPYKKHIAKFSIRHPFSKYRGMEMNYSYPFFGAPDLFFYAKVFSGYGESLIDYDRKLTKVGFGFSISR